MAKRIQSASMRPMPEFSAEREASFWSRTRKVPGACWVWHGAVGSKGYPMFTYGNGYTLMAHRVAYYLANKTDPGSLLVLHTCDVPLCVNPDHLFLGTQQENIRDALQKDRWAIGERHHSAKLTAEEVREIRRMRAEDGATYAAIAARFGVTIANVHGIVKRMTWRQIQ